MSGAADLPPCFGVLWQAVEGSFCALACRVQQTCLVRFLEVAVLGATERLGGRATPSALAQELRVPVEAVRRALDVAEAWRVPDEQPEQVPATEQVVEEQLKARRRRKPRAKPGTTRRPRKGKAKSKGCR